MLQQELQHTSEVIIDLNNSFAESRIKSSPCIRIVRSRVEQGERGVLSLVFSLFANAITLLYHFTYSYLAFEKFPHFCIIMTFLGVCFLFVRFTNNVEYHK